MAATDELGALGPLLQEYEQVEAQMADPQTLADPQLMRRVGRRYAELGRVKAAADRLASASGDLEAPESWPPKIAPSPMRFLLSRKRKWPPTRRS